MRAAEVSEDQEWAWLASATEEQVEEDEDCTEAADLVEAASYDLGRMVSAHLLAAKSALAQKAQARQAQMQAQAQADRAVLEQAIDDEVAARLAVNEQLDKARAVQQRLADALYAAREGASTRMQALVVMGEWQRSLAALKREAHCERLAGPHYAKTLLRMCVGRWRSAARKSRHARIDSFWEHSVIQLRSALAGHYEPKLQELQAELATAHADAAAAWQAKEDLGTQLKAAFMRGVCNLNLETSKLIGEQLPTSLLPGGDEPEPSPLQAPPRPTRPEEVLAKARRGLPQAAARP